MRIRLPLTLMLILLMPACNKEIRSLSESDPATSILALENLARENLKDWEPPFNEEGFLSDFTRSEDFSFTVDGFHVSDFEQWKSIVQESMAYDRENYSSYTHVIRGMDVTMLGSEAGMVCVDYLWVYRTPDHVEVHTPATVTSLCRLEGKDWKIVNSHVSHGEERVQEMGTKQAIADTLGRMAVDFLRSWEPPFHPDKTLGLFTRSEDFCLIIDGLPIETYEEWARGVPNFMADDQNFFTTYKHEIKDLKTVVLSENAGVVTIIYDWDSVTREGVHRKTEGAITLSCRRESEGWRIVHYHGSHGEDQVLEDG